ncbi:MAG: AsmA family protein [Elusimicrobiaceae bacterium]|nr:AsmA family protein [Elusimicrobiaceae bacterium]
MKRVWIKRISVGIMIIAVGLIGLHVMLKMVSASGWFNDFATKKLSAALGREVRLGHLGLDLRGVWMKDFALAKAGGFEQGTDVRVDKLQLRVSLGHLLYGHVKVISARIDGLELHMRRTKDGQFNLDFSSPQETEQEPPSTRKSFKLPVGLSVMKLSFRDMHFSYTDEQIPLALVFKNTHLLVRNFSLDKPFVVSFGTQAIHLPNTPDEQEFQGTLSAEVSLADLDLSQASVQLKKVSLRSGKSQVELSGSVSNFAEPFFALTLAGKYVSGEVLKGFATPQPDLSVSDLTWTAHGTLEQNYQQLKLEETRLTLPGLEWTAQGTADLANEKYDFTSQAQAYLAKLEKGLPFLKPYQLTGDMDLNARLNKGKLLANLSLKQAGARAPRVGDLSGVQADFESAEKMDFTQGKSTLTIQGNLNGEPFKTNVTLVQEPSSVFVRLGLFADRFILLPAPPTQQAAPDHAPATPAAEEQPAAASSWPLPPITSIVTVEIGSLDAPYLNGKNLKLGLDMSGITPKLDNAHGLVSLSISDGQITDLYQLTDSNAIMKVLFMSLKVVGKVFNSLDVLSVLGGLAGSSDKTDGTEEVIKMIPGPDGELVAVKVPVSSRKVDGKLAYDTFETEVEFEQGLATVRKGSFVSDMMSFNLSGTTNFTTEKLDMTVHAAPGKHKTNGIMPLTLKIGGTVNDPQGNMSIVGSVSSLVSQGVTNNFASRAVKKGIGSVLGLFKKKEQEQPAKETAQDQPGTEADDTLPVATGEISATK